MRLLMLGGTSFVGRTVVSAAVDRGWSVTTFNRGAGGPAHPGVTRLLGDRRDPRDLAVLGAGQWDAVIDTWSGAPLQVRDTAQLLSDRAARYLYVSSRAVYRTPTPVGLDESCPTVPAAPAAGTTGYAADKRGAEIAVESVFGDRAVLARAGLILGPHENVGRLPYWLRRIERGGQVLAPGPASLPVQYIDVRDLADWLLGTAERQLAGPVNLVTPPEHATMQRLLQMCVAVTGGDAELVWVDPAAIRDVQLHRWTELPGWIPPDPEFAGLRSTNTDRARTSGLVCRSIEDTVRDTWTWLTGPDHHPVPALDSTMGLNPDKERAALAEWHHRNNNNSGSSW